MLLVRKMQKIQEELINRQQQAQEAYRQGATQNQGYRQAQTQTQQKGNMTITVAPNIKNSNTQQYDDGEYIDYEEVK